MEKVAIGVDPLLQNALTAVPLEGTFYNFTSNCFIRDCCWDDGRAQQRSRCHNCCREEGNSISRGPAAGLCWHSMHGRTARSTVNTCSYAATLHVGV